MSRRFEVTPINEARNQLPQLLSQFETDGVNATPLIFGRHRKPEAVVIPYDLFEWLLERLDDLASLEPALDQAAGRLDTSNDEFISWDEVIEQVEAEPAAG